MLHLYANQISWNTVRFGATPNRHLLEKLRQDFIQVADQHSSNDPSEYERRKGICPLTGHCAAVANYIQQHYGGVAVRGVLKIYINGQERIEKHYWNRIDGKEFDLTGSQYGGDGLHPLDDPQGKMKPHVSADGITIEFFRIESKEVRTKINPSPWFEVFNTRMARLSPN